jgi:hypothetical protein
MVGLLVLGVVLPALLVLCAVLYRRPSGRVDPAQLPAPEAGAEARYEIDKKAPPNAFGGSGGTIW